MSDPFSSTLPPVVVDASAAIELLNGNPAWVEAFTGWARSERMRLAPTLLWAEVANAQLRGARLAVTEVAARVERLAATGIETADRRLPGLLEALALADRHGLTIYDALYLQLAIDVEGELATLDGLLRAAAEEEGVPVI